MHPAVALHVPKKQRTRQYASEMIMVIHQIIACVREDQNVRINYELVHYVDFSEASRRRLMPASVIELASLNASPKKFEGQFAMFPNRSTLSSWACAFPSLTSQK